MTRFGYLVSRVARSFMKDSVSESKAWWETPLLYWFSVIFDITWRRRKWNLWWPCLHQETSTRKGNLETQIGHLKSEGMSSRATPLPRGGQRGYEFTFITREPYKSLIETVNLHMTSPWPLLPSLPHSIQDSSSSLSAIYIQNEAV